VSVTAFLSNDTLWQALTARIKAAGRVDAAIAYFGQGGAKILPLRSGHRLVVDMSPRTVRAGGTDPREVEKLIQRGVQAFTRRNLHAKIVVADKSVISGSANVSRQSQQTLDEAAILTTDPSAVRRAQEFIDRICTEPIRPEYLEKCKTIYRPPRFAGQRSDGKDGFHQPPPRSSGRAGPA
jgi:phosphatidylserine/phosphatidylglycerophosphate/cardiolipin synthase-like enzyme